MWHSPPLALTGMLQNIYLPGMLGTKPCLHFRVVMDQLITSHPRAFISFRQLEKPHEATERHRLHEEVGFMRRAIALNGFVIQLVPNLCAQRVHGLSAVRQNGLALEFLSQAECGHSG